MKKLCLYITLIALAACHKKEAATEQDISAENIRTPVTITAVSYEPLLEYTDLNATSTFMQSNVIKASANGYIQSVHVALNSYVNTGQLAFVLKTKEAKALGNTINVLDSSFRFTGLIKVYATASGYVSQLDHKPGDYVQDGEQLALVTDAKSFGFVLNVPYELRPYISPAQALDLELPDKTHLKGSVAGILPVLDSASQTMAVKISVAPGRTIPQNLVAKVRIVKSSRSDVQSLPKAAVLADESQNNFWVMKMTDSVTAVKIPVIKGMETADRVEIVKPVFNKTDKILLTGNYGLADTAKVIITKGAE
jgi:hypothetical protein